MKVGLFIFPVRFASMPPIDIAYLAAYLRERGHDVYVRDFNAECLVDNDCDGGFWNQQKNQQDLFSKNKVTVERWVEDILAFSPDFVGMSVWESQLYFSQEIARMIKNKRKEIRVIFGGPWCSYCERGLPWIKNEYADYTVFGEGEFTLAEIVESWDSRNSIPGCFKKTDGEILDGGWREETVNPDLLPYPDYSNFDFTKYLYTSTYPILFNRGCNWNCSFCTLRCVWQHFRSRSAENVFAEIEDCFSKHPFIRRFYSCDHSMNSNMVLLRRLCELIIENNVKIEKFAGYGQVNSEMMDEEFLKKLKRAGFNSWGIGIQSGSDRILKSMRRPYTVAQAEKMLKEMHNQGLGLSIDLIVGYPEENEADFRQTLDFTSRVGRYVGNISVSPYCSIEKNDLGFNPRKYGIYALNEGGNTWESFNCNPEIRSRRHRIIMEHFSSLGVSHRYSDSDRKFWTDTTQEP